MSKRNEEYWRDRAIEREAYWNTQSREKVEKALARHYYNAMRRIQDETAALYGRFADDNGLSLKEARKLLEGNEFRQWRMSLEQYTRLSASDNAVLRELNTLAMRSRISRLEKLYGQTLVELYKLGKYVEKDMRNFFSDAYKDNYYKGLFEIGKTAGLHGSIGTVSREQLERVLSNPWSGKNYSSRIWTNQQKLAQALKDTVFSGVHRGLSVPKMSKMIQQRMNVGKNEATRLVRTELNYIHNQANLASIEDSGLEFYKFVATLDSRTSQKCRAHDGSIIPVEEASPGDNLPPLHPHCRSTIIGSLGEGKGGQKGTRAARVGKKGKTFYVPQQMQYNDYKAVYVDKSKSFSAWAKENGFKGLATKYTPPAPSQGNAGGGIIEPKEKDYADEIAKARAQLVSLERQQSLDWTVERDQAITDLHNNIDSLKVEAAKKGEILTSGLQNVLPKDDIAKIANIVRKAPEDYRIVWNRFEENMTIATKDNPDGAWYKPKDRSIYFNLQIDRNGKPPYRTIFHELGHLIDHFAGKNYYFPSAFRNGAELRESLKREGKAYLADLKAKMQAEVVAKGGKAGQVKMDMVYYRLKTELMGLTEEQVRDVSDMWDGITRKKANGGWGHKASYWKDENSLPIEAFAEMFCSSICNPDSLAVIKQYFPESYKVFEGLIRDIAEKGRL